MKPFPKKLFSANPKKQLHIRKYAPILLTNELQYDHFPWIFLKIPIMAPCDSSEQPKK